MFSNILSQGKIVRGSSLEVDMAKYIHGRKNQDGVNENSHSDVIAYANDNAVAVDADEQDRKVANLQKPYICNNDIDTDNVEAFDYDEFALAKIYGYCV